MLLLHTLLHHRNSTLQRWSFCSRCLQLTYQKVFFFSENAFLRTRHLSSDVFATFSLTLGREKTCCCKVSTVILNSWHEGCIKFIFWGRLYGDRSGWSTSRLFSFYLMYLFALFMKQRGCFTISEISPSPLFKIWDKTVIMYLAGVLFSSKKVENAVSWPIIVLRIKPLGVRFWSCLRFSKISLVN